MTDERDTALGAALRELPVPDHRDGFWELVEAGLGEPTIVADSGQEPTTEWTTTGPAPESTGKRWQPSRRLSWAFAAAALLILAIGVVAALQLFRGDPGPMIEDPVTTTTTTSGSTDTTVSSEPGPTPARTSSGPTFAALDSDGDPGRYPSLIVGADGVPVVVYATGSDDNPLRLARCADGSCIGDATFTPVETAGGTHEASMVIGADGLPVYAWWEFPAVDVGDDKIKLFKCADSACSTGTLAELGPGSQSPDLAVGPDNLPTLLASTWDGVTAVVKCEDPACSNTTRTPIEGLVDGKIAVGLDSYPVIATAQVRIEGEAPQVTLMRCTDPACAGDVLISELALPAYGVEDLALAADGVPVILTVSIPEGDSSYLGDLVLIACTDRECTSPTVTTITQANGPDILGEGRFGSMAVSSGDRVSIVYASQSSGGRILTVATCNDPTCSGGITHSPTRKVDQWVWLSMALNPAGNPVVAYNSASDLNVMVCADPLCLAPDFVPPSTQPATGWETNIVDEGGALLEGFSPSVAIDGNRLPTIVYNSDQGPILVSCNDPACSSSSTTVLGVGGQASIVLTEDGLPRVVSHTQEWDGVALIVCRDRACTDRETVRVFDEWINGAPAIATSPEGTVIAYQHPSDWYVWVESCLDEECTETSAGRLDSLADPGEDGEPPTRWWIDTLDIAVPRDGLPVIGVAQADGTVRVAKCTTADCTESTTEIVADTGDDWITADLKIGPDGNPLMAFYSDGRIWVAVCHDPACLAFTATDIDEAVSGQAGSIGPAIEIGADGLALIAYWTPAREVKLAKCLDDLCSETVVSDVATLDAFNLAVTTEGSPLLAYYQRAGPESDALSGQGFDLVVARCRTGMCTENE